MWVWVWVWALRYLSSPVGAVPVLDGWLVLSALLLGAVPVLNGWLVLSTLLLGAVPVLYSRTFGAPFDWNTKDP